MRASIGVPWALQRTDRCVVLRPDCHTFDGYRAVVRVNQSARGAFAKSPVSVRVWPLLFDGPCLVKLAPETPHLVPLPLSLLLDQELDRQAPFSISLSIHAGPPPALNGRGCYGVPFVLPV